MLFCSVAKRDSRYNAQVAFVFNAACQLRETRLSHCKCQDNKRPRLQEPEKWEAEWGKPGHGSGGNCAGGANQSGFYGLKK